MNYEATNFDNRIQSISQDNNSSENDKNIVDINANNEGIFEINNSNDNASSVKESSKSSNSENYEQYSEKHVPKLQAIKKFPPYERCRKLRTNTDFTLSTHKDNHDLIKI